MGAEQHIDSKMGRRGRESRGQNWGNKSSFGVYFSTDGGSFDSTHYAVEDIGEMPESIMITCTAEIGGGDGTVCMVGGDMNDYHAGYMVFATQGSIWFCVQMTAHGAKVMWLTSALNTAMALPSSMSTETSLQRA